jgi:molybdopterin-synthase adenylyltransferase
VLLYKYKTMLENTEFKINPSVSIFVKNKSENQYEVLFLFNGTRKTITYACCNEVINIIKVLGVNNNILGIANKLNISKVQLVTIVEKLLNDNIVQLISKNVIDQNSVFSRQLNFFSNFANTDEKVIEFHNKLVDSSIAILGLGGIGSWVAYNLVKMGIGKVYLIDFDKIEATNISRSCFYNLDDVGKYKSETLAIKLNEVWQTNVAKPFNFKVESVSDFNNLPQLPNLVINCADEPDVEDTNALISKYSHKAKTPYITCGGYNGHLSYIGQTVIPNDSSCWFCYSESGIHEKNIDGYESLIINQAQTNGGTISPICSLIASIQTLEAVRILTKIDSPAMLNKRGEIDFYTLQINYIDIPKLAHCTNCSVIKNET